MDFARLRELEEIFGHRWDALVLLCLADGPRRFNQLAAAMNAVADEWLSDNVLGRSLHRLVGGGLVARSGERRGRLRAYSLTESGARRVRQLARYLQQGDAGLAESGGGARIVDRARPEDATNGRDSRSGGERALGVPLPSAAGGYRLRAAPPRDGGRPQGTGAIMDSPAQGAANVQQATAARVYDYFLGGYHNFAADQEVARRVIEQFPDMPANARANRAVLRRAVGYLTAAGIRQFLDIGSGIPTQGNVHEIAQRVAPEARVLYVDIDPVAVAESLEILDGNPHATAIRGDLRDPAGILTHPTVQRLLDLRRPTALLLAAVLHFIPGPQAYALVAELTDALAPGSYLFVSHAASETNRPDSDGFKTAAAVYRQQTTSQVTPRTRAEVERFFTGLDLVDPGVVALPAWRPDPGEADPLASQPGRSLGWVGLAAKPATG